MPSPKIVLTADRTLMSPYRKLSLATFFGCAPALDPHRDPKSFWYKILGRQVTPKILFDFICNYIPHTNGVAVTHLLQKYYPFDFICTYNFSMRTDKFFNVIWMCHNHFFTFKTIP